ncbi:hypothetical protein H4Q26_004880 [Puccinia striiformis f. sp. tritici PST-130]|nr:hypothetical protein H4Q26_004880 [Puccinia striiformis f. sp. tritici PST-130]
MHNQARAIPRTRIEDIDRVALQTRITDGTIVLTDKRTNRTLTVSEIKGSDSGAPTPKIKKNSYLVLFLFHLLRPSHHSHHPFIIFQIDPYPYLVEVSQSPHTHITIEGAAKASALRY